MHLAFQHSRLTAECWLRQDATRSWAADQKLRLDALTALSKDTVAMLLAAADAEDAPTRHGMLAAAADAARAVLTPLSDARAAWAEYFDRSEAAMAAEVVTPAASGVLQRNAVVRRGTS